MPFPYYYASLLLKLGFTGVNGLRLGMSLAILGFWILIIILFRDTIDYKILCTVIFLSALAHPLFWGHMLLADSFFAYAILVIFLYFYGKPELNFSFFDSLIISAMVFICLTSSVVSIFPLAVLGVYYCIIKIRRMSRQSGGSLKPFLLEEIKFAGIIAIPYVILLGLFIYLGILKDFFSQAILFNVDYVGGAQVFSLAPLYNLCDYIVPYLVHGDRLFQAGSYINPSAYDNNPFFMGFFLITSNLVAAAFLWKRRSSLFSVAFLVFILYLGYRGFYHFHAVPYFLVSFFCIGLVIADSAHFLQAKVMNSGNAKIKKFIGGILIALYILGTILFLGMLTFAYFSNGSGTGARDADISPYDAIIQTLTRPGEKIWVAPLDPALYFRNNREPASRYTFYLPWQAQSKNINQEIINDLQRNRPALVIFDRDADTIHNGVSSIKIYGVAVDQYMSMNYIRVDPGDPILKNVYFLKGSALAEGITNTNEAGKDLKYVLGVFREGVWYLDISGDRTWDTGDMSTTFGTEGDLPVVGDWNGDGRDEIGVFRNGTWRLDSSRDWIPDDNDLAAVYGAPGDLPVVGDWNGDRKDEIGIFHEGQWQLDWAGDRIMNSLGRRFGVSKDIPVVIGKK